ncbi:MAG: hypothetical protein LBU89_03240, partial [Fibromonadaceae bacterium]|nr:hypothetical protein [Fibromonadaceae bacterium]
MQIKILAILLISFSFVFGGVEVHSRLASDNLFGNEMSLHLRIYNNSSEKLDLSESNLIYRFSDNSSLDKFAYNIWWFSVGNASNARISFHESASGEKFFKLYFLNGEIASGAHAEIQLRVHKTDWSFFNMIGDYSLPLSGTEWAANPNIAFNGPSFDFPILIPEEQNKADLSFPDILLALSDYSVFGTNEVRLADRVS